MLDRWLLCTRLILYCAFVFILSGKLRNFHTTTRTFLDFDRRGGSGSDGVRKCAECFHHCLRSNQNNCLQFPIPTFSLSLLNNTNSFLNTEFCEKPFLFTFPCSDSVLILCPFLCFDVSFFSPFSLFPLLKPQTNGSLNGPKMNKKRKGKEGKKQEGKGKITPKIKEKKDRKKKKKKKRKEIR